MCTDTVCTYLVTSTFLLLLLLLAFTSLFGTRFLHGKCIRIYLGCHAIKLGNTLHIYWFIRGIWEFLKLVLTFLKPSLVYKLGIVRVLLESFPKMYSSSSGLTLLHFLCLNQQVGGKSNTRQFSNQL